MIQIRKALLKELPIVREIAYQTWPDTFADILSPPQIEYMLKLMYDLKTLESQLLEKGQVFLLAEEEGEFLGFAAYELNYSECPKAKLHKIYLLPEAQGKGAGKGLILEVAERARKADQKSLLLNVNKFNQKAIHFYTRIGFNEIYKEVIDIGNGYVMDDVVMELIL
jgi:ribosomal protein S18 acetylase RimI-like enzyme